MKRVLSILVLVVFLAHFAGFYIYFFVQVKQVRKEMKARLRTLPTDKLELVKLSSRDLNNARVDDHEIKINGKMYDIARIEKVGDNYFVYCLHDKGEDSLLAFLDKMLSLPLKDKKALPQVLKFASLTFLLPSVNNLHQPLDIQFRSFTKYTLGTITFVPSVDSPPPQV